MNNFNKGDVVHHKATMKRCVVKGKGVSGGSILVTTSDDEIKSYQPEELWTEEEWNKRNKNFN